MPVSSDTNVNVKKISFSQFYQEHYLAEHTHRLNVALHVFGTLMGLLLLLACIIWLPWYWVFTFPIVHALPGLIGHRLFERNQTVGDVRVLRKDFSGLWFIAANHLLTFRLFKRLIGFS